MLKVTTIPNNPALEGSYPVNPVAPGVNTQGALGTPLTIADQTPVPENGPSTQPSMYQYPYPPKG